MRWKLLGLAGLAGVTASGAVVVRRRRDQQELEPDELRDKLYERLAQTRTGDDEPAPQPNRPPFSSLRTEDGGRFEEPGAGADPSTG